LEKRHAYDMSKRQPLPGVDARARDGAGPVRLYTSDFPFPRSTRKIGCRRARDGSSTAPKPPIWLTTSFGMSCILYQIRESTAHLRARTGVSRVGRGPIGEGNPHRRGL